MNYKTFSQWLEMKSNPPGSAGGSDLVAKTKQKILQQSGQPGTNADDVAEKVLKQAAQEASNDPEEGIETAVKIGKALDKVAKQKLPMTKKMKK